MSRTLRVPGWVWLTNSIAEKKNAKASSRSAAFQAKKSALIAGARKDAETMAREGRAYM